MRGHFLSKTDRKTLGRFPLVVDPEELVHCFSLTEHDHQEILWRRKRPGGRLAAGLQIGALRLLGFIPVELHTAPVEAVRFVADQVEAHVDDLETYSTRARTLQAHAELIERHLGFRRTRPDDIKMLGDWLVERALEHDRPVVLFRMACRHLKTEGLVRPGVTVLERLVLNARRRATEVTWQKLEPYTDADRRRRLDALLDVDLGLGMTPLAWFHQQATAAVPMMICSQLTKLERLRELDVDPATVKNLNPNRVRHLASLGRRMTAQALRRSEPARRYQILTATVVETLYSLTDEILELFDIALAIIDRRARNDFDKLQLATARKSNIVARLFGEIGRLVLNDDISDNKLRARIFNVTTREDLEEMVERAERIARPKDECHLDFLLNRYGYTRQYTPQILAAFDFQAAHPEDPLTVALKVLKKLNRQGTRLVPADAPTDFATRKWRRRLIDSKGRIYRKHWEFCTLFRAREALRGANLWVEHSRRYQNPKNFLLSDEDWRILRPRTEPETGICLDGPRRLEQLDQELAANLGMLEAALRTQDAVRIEDDRFVIPPVVADPDPALASIRDRVVTLLPEIDIVDLLFEVDAWCGFLSAFVHAGPGAEPGADHTEKLIAVLVANGCNLGLANMARCTGFDLRQLMWTQNWFVRDETVTTANTALVNHQHAQPVAEIWGTGTLSSSDGQRFPFTVRNPTARAMRRYYTRTGATVYTWTSDQHTQYGTRVIPTTVREATHVLDAIFDNETDLDIEEHTTDTAGYTDLVFGLFDLTGLRFSPRLRGLADQRLWRLATTPTQGAAAGFLKHSIHPNLFLDRWDDLLRIAATIRHGHSPASLLVSRLQASARKNDLTRALQEYGRVIKTISALRSMHSKDKRRQVHQQLNKGESIHALRRKLFFANLGQLQRRRPDDQELQAQCLTLLTNAIICWNTVYLAAAFDHIENSDGIVLDTATRQHLSPTVHRHINLHGRYDLSNLEAPSEGNLRPLQT